MDGLRANRPNTSRRLSGTLTGRAGCVTVPALERRRRSPSTSGAVQSAGRADWKRPAAEREKPETRPQDSCRLAGRSRRWFPICTAEAAAGLGAKSQASIPAGARQPMTRQGLRRHALKVARGKLGGSRGRLAGQLWCTAHAGLQTRRARFDFWRLADVVADVKRSRCCGPVISARLAAGRLQLQLFRPRESQP